MEEMNSRYKYAYCVLFAAITVANKTLQDLLCACESGRDKKEVEKVLLKLRESQLIAEEIIIKD